MIKLSHIDNGNAFDFGKTSIDYAKYRDVYPDVFYRKIHDLGLCGKEQLVLDLGTGSGVLPRNLIKYGAKFIGVDISENQIAQAKILSEGMNIEYIVSPVEKIDFSASTFNTVLACMCFTYFDKSILMPILSKILKDDGYLAILSLIYIPNESNIAKTSEDIILKHNSTWNGAGYTRPMVDNNGMLCSLQPKKVLGFTRPRFNSKDILLGYEVDTSLGFELAPSFSFDVSIPFTRESWHGRIKASRGIGASSLTQEQLSLFEIEHWRFMKEQPENFEIIHSAIFCILKKHN